MLHTRMLLSCLCDADYLTTASHENEDVLKLAEEIPLNASNILNKLTSYRNKIASSSSANPKINRIREKIYTDCLGETLIVNNLTFTQESDRVDNIRVIAETQDIIVGSSRFLLCCHILVQIGQNISL